MHPHHHHHTCMLLPPQRHHPYSIAPPYTCTLTRPSVHHGRTHARMPTDAVGVRRPVCCKALRLAGVAALRSAAGWASAGRQPGRASSGLRGRFGLQQRAALPRAVAGTVPVTQQRRANFCGGARRISSLPPPWTWYPPRSTILSTVRHLHGPHRTQSFGGYHTRHHHVPDCYEEGCNLQFDGRDERKTRLFRDEGGQGQSGGVGLVTVAGFQSRAGPSGTSGRAVLGCSGASCTSAAAPPRRRACHV